MDRRTFISLSALLPFFGFGKLISSLSKDSSNSIFKRSLLKDPDKIVDLHHALKYRIISQKGLPMSDGFKVPGLADGMGAFLIEGEIVLVRKHEIVPKHGMGQGAFQNPDTQIDL